MPTLYELRNETGAQGTWSGQTLDAAEIYVIPHVLLESIRDDEEIFQAVASQDLMLLVDSVEIVDPIVAWNMLYGDTLPKSDLDGKKLAVHTSYKPKVDGVTTYAVWSGSGDDLVTDIIGDGDLLHFDMDAGTSSVTKDVKFLAAGGRVWIHEAYLKFSGAGDGDFIEASIIAPATVLQTGVNLDLVLDGDYIKYSSGGPGSGTHGFAATPVIIPRPFSNDGDWDYDGVSLLPNMGGTGGYNMSTIEQPVNKYINKIPCTGDCPYFSMSSDETSEILQPYYIKVTTHNPSGSVWHASVIMEIYREQTL